MNILRKINFSQKISKRIMKNAEYFKDLKKLNSNFNLESD